MDADQDLPTQIRDSFASILSLDEDKQKAEILRIYDEGCHLENSYLMLQVSKRTAERWISMTGEKWIFMT